MSTVQSPDRTAFIDVRGARQHNLKNIDVQVPHGQLVVVTGPSGSGKSSLAVSTIFAEGQRQYVETLSTYARQFVAELPRPDMDSIAGLQPTLCIDQHPSTNSPRSTVGTVTEIHDYLRVLMARAADIRCHQCGNPIRQMSGERIVEWVSALPEGTKAIILAPLVRGRRGKQVEILEQIRKAGLLRARIDGQLMEVDTVTELDARKNHTVEAVTDRIVVRAGNTQRISESIDLALRMSEGTCVVRHQAPEDERADDEGWVETVFSTRYACPQCDVAYSELEPRNFSFNSPYGACPTCEGLGWSEQFDPDLILDSSRSIADGGIVAWQGLGAATRKKRLANLSNFDTQKRLTSFRPAAMQKLLHGDNGDWAGLLNELEKEFATSTSDHRLDELDSMRGLVACRDCDASRLGPQARSALLDGQTIIDINRAPLSDVRDFFERLEFDADRQDIGGPLASEIAARLGFLCQTGLGYLTLDRPADSLSGGEYQRVRLAASIGSGLANVCYVLDEPTIGLHPADNDRLIQSIIRLRQTGNSVIVVEHDADMMQHADWIIDIGPGAGQDGGQLVFAGTYENLLQAEGSLTGNYLAQQQHTRGHRTARALNPDHVIRIRGAAANNLQNVDVEIPLGLLVGVTGVSGSGKSTLIDDTLAPAVLRHLGRVAPRPGLHRGFEVCGPLENVVRVDQRPIGRSARSNAATYTGVMDHLRKLFASTKLAKARGYTASRFSFNSSAGWCPDCQGYGERRIEMNFLPDMHAPCEACRGRRFNHQTLEVRYRDHSIADVLEMSIADGCEFFQNVDVIYGTMQALCDVGLGYLSLGQASTTLSGGEAQRVKLATELSRSRQGNTLYLLDEPTTGLHFADVQRLLDVLHQLVDKGNSVLVIEHHMDLVAATDWIIDLGPGGGQQGGQVVACGPPAAIAENASSQTGRFLRPALTP